jgi:hypothetical protein
MLYPHELEINVAADEPEPPEKVMIRTAQDLYATVVGDVITSCIAEGEHLLMNMPAAIVSGHLVRTKLMPDADMIHVTWRGIPILNVTEPRIELVTRRRVVVRFMMGQLPPASEKTIQKSFE